MLARRSSHLALTAALSAFGLGIAAAPADAAEVIAFGDGWASGGAGPLQTALSTAGLSLMVSDFGAPGFAADDYATSATGTIAAALAANPDAQWVWISLGFQDLVDRYPAENAGQIATATDLALRTILADLFTSAPNIRVVMFGYDYMDYTTGTCPIQLATDFGALASQFDASNLTVMTVGAVAQGIADDFPNVNYVSLYGTMQLDGGTPGAPDINQPSPASHMLDCTNPNGTGFSALMGALTTAYWGQPVPVAVASASATTICSGDMVTFTSMSTNNEGQVWRLEGTQTSTQPVWTAALSGTGTTTVTLEAYNRAWTDTATLSIIINDCSDAGVADTGVIDSGAMDAGAMDAGGVDAAPDAAPDAGFPDAAPDAGPDAGFPDAAPDAGPDAGFPDAEADAGPDAGFPDAEADAGPDAGFPDAEADAGPDAGFPDAEADAGPDAGFPDAEVDAGPDAGFPDAEPMDAEPLDAEPMDAEPLDAEPMDAEPLDAEPMDADPRPDAEPVDAAPVPDVGPTPDAGPSVDAASPDAGAPPPDAGAAVDSGTRVFEQIGINGNGCSCDSRETPDESPSPWLASGLLSLLLLRRRRR